MGSKLDQEPYSAFISCWALVREGDYKMHPMCACVCVGGGGMHALMCHTDFSKMTTAIDFLSINCPNEFSCPWKFLGFYGLSPEDKCVIVILATLSKGLIT